MEKSGDKVSTFSPFCRKVDRMMEISSSEPFPAVTSAGFT